MATIELFWYLIYVERQLKKTGKSKNADVREDIIKMSRATICFELLDIAG
jgi:hypothetical protein